MNNFFKNFCNLNLILTFVFNNIFKHELLKDIMDFLSVDLSRNQQLNLTEIKDKRRCLRN
jgi:hypothetical protein